MTTQTLADRAPLMPVTDLAQRGRILTQRRMRHGIRHISEAADLARIDRKTVARAEKGIASPSSMEAYEAFFDRLDAETGINSLEGLAPEADQQELIEFDIEGPTTAWHVVVRGPMGEADEVRRQAAELLRGFDRGSETA